jgi:hypothetical protein
VSWSVQWQETKSASLSGQTRTIVQAIESAAFDLMAKLEEADRQAQLRHQKWLADEERRRQEEDRRRVEQSVADSRSELGRVIKQWADVMSVERFLVGVEQRARDLPETDRHELLERLALARSFLGEQDPLAFFREWKTPEERYAPQYPLRRETRRAHRGRNSGDKLLLD